MPARITSTRSAAGHRPTTPSIRSSSGSLPVAPGIVNPVGASASPRSVTVAVVDPYTLTRTALPVVLPEFTFTGSFCTAADLLSAAPSADVVLLEIVGGAGNHSPFLVWTRTVQTVVAAGYRVCIHTAERRQAVLLGGLSAGATSIVHKSDSVDDLRAAVRDTAAGRTILTPLLAGPAEPAGRRYAMPSLTDRQRTILSARARGEKFESIARRLFVSRKVAEEHWAAVARKFAGFLRDHSPADLERLLGLDPGDLVDRSPAELLDGELRAG